MLLPQMSHSLARRVAGTPSVVQGQGPRRHVVIAYWALVTGAACFSLSLLLTVLVADSSPETSSNIIVYTTVLGLLIGWLVSHIRVTAVDKAYMMFVGSFVAMGLLFIVLHIVFLAAQDVIMHVLALYPRLTLQRLVVALLAFSLFVPGARLGLWLRGR